MELNLLLVLVIVMSSLLSIVPARPNEGVIVHALHADKECPRKPELIGHRKCLKKCRTNEDCRGRNKRCLCDDVCGKSCVKPALRCETLKPIFNGKYDILPFNTFGAKVVYTCTAGYVLDGEPERVCQGDGYWSGQAPTCATHGTPIIGIIDEGKCRDPPVVPFANQDGAPGQRVFPLGTQLTYTCAAGYNIDGFFRAMCVGEGRWVGPRMTCSPRRCGDPGDIQNGHREGNVFIYPNRVTYICNEGYELVGRSYRACQASGQWSGQVPSCKPVRCPRLGAPANGHMHGQDFTYGAIIRFSCFRGFRLVGSQARRCQQDGTWSGQTATCAMVDCGIPGPFYNGYLDGQQTTFGAVIIFRCFGPATFEGGPSSTTCQENGQWSNPLPKCWSKCEVPRINNGTSLKHKPGRLLPHKSTLNFECEDGHNINTTDEAVCHNGTWSFIPECEPSPCDSERPMDIPNGFVRYHGVRHGDKAKYRCNTGYKLVGDTFMTCNYGKWLGKEKPYCDPVYCPYPGTIKNGQILLVGVIGKYEYRPYVRRIGHNEQIEYQCNKGYKRVGPQAATCVDGQWSPDSKPYCVPGQHPRLMYIFRGKRSLSDRTTGLLSDKSTGPISDRITSLMADKTTGLLSDKTTSLIADKTTGVVSDKATALLPAESTSLLSDKSKGLILQKSTSLLPVKTASLISEKNKGLLIDESTGLRSDESTGLTSENATRLLPAKTTSLISDKATGLIPEKATGLLSDETTGLLWTPQHAPQPRISHLTSGDLQETPPKVTTHAQKAADGGTELAEEHKAEGDGTAKTYSHSTRPSETPRHTLVGSDQQRSASSL